MFVITGRPEDVSAARREVLAAAEHFTQIRAARKSNAAAAAAAASNMAPNIGSPVEERVSIYVRVPYRVVGLVVGPKGATIKRIQQVTSTYIVTPSRDKEPCFEVTGTPDNVERAKREIESYIAMRTGNSITDSDGESDYTILSPSIEPVFSPSHGQLGRKHSEPSSKMLHQFSPRSSASPPSSTYNGNDSCLEGYPNGWGVEPITSHSSPLTSAVFGTRGGGGGGGQGGFVRANSMSSECMFSYSVPPMSAPAFSSSGVFDFTAVRDTLKQDPPSPTYSCGSNSSEGTSVNSPKLSQRRNTCCMCRGKEVVAALVPCGHNLFCFSCASNLATSAGPCPVCGLQVSAVLRIYTQ